VVLYKRQNIFKKIDPEELAYMPLWGHGGRKWKRFISIF
jgi:hypothetical protein